MYKNFFRIGSFLFFTVLCSCAPQESYVKPSAQTSKDVASLDGLMDYTQFTAKIRIQWIKMQLNDYLFELRQDPSKAKKNKDIFPLKIDKKHDAESLLCHQRLMEIRERAGRAYLKSVASAISQKVEEPGQDIGKLLSDLVNDSSINLAYEVPEKAIETCSSDFLNFYKTVYITSNTPESLAAAVEAGAALYGLLKEVVIALGQESVRAKNALELRSFLLESKTQKEINDAIQATNDVVTANSKIDKRYAVNRFRRAYFALNEAVKNTKPIQISECKSFFAAKEVGADSSDFQSCADAVYAKLEDRVSQTVAEASKYDIEADKDPAALIGKVTTDFGNLKKLAEGDWKFSTYVDLVSSVVRVGRLANTVNNKLKSDEVKKAIDELVKELK